MLKKNSAYSCLFFFLFFLCLAKGQEPGMWHITDQDGLASMTVYGTVQDKEGYVWMGTEKGVCRFDGKAFKYYKSSKLNDNEILKIKTDAYGRIWFKNLTGQLFYIEDGLFYDAQSLFQQTLPRVQDFIIENNTIWLSLEKDQELSLAKFSFEQKNKEASYITYPAKQFNYFSSFIFHEGFVYLLGRLTEKKGIKIIELDPNANEFKEILFSTNNKSLPIRSAFFYKNELFIISKKSEKSTIYKLEHDKLVPFIELDPPNNINDLMLIEHSLWIQTSTGIFVHSMLEDESSPSYLLNNISTNHLMIDHEGNKWISTTGQGVFVLNAPQSKLYQTNNSNLPNNEIYSLEYDSIRKRLLIGHGQGLLSIIDKDFNNQIVPLNVSGRTVDILVDHKGKYWCGNDRGLFLIDRDLTVQEQLDFTLKYCLESNDNDLWGGTYNTVFKIAEKHIDSFYFENKKQYKVILNQKTYALVQDFSGDIWMGTINGIYISKEEEVIPFLENKIHVPYNIAAMVQGPDSTIWVGTRGDGLLGIKHDKIIYRFKEPGPLASNTIKSLSATENALWVGTDNGLNKLNLKTKKWEWVHDPDGFPSREINAIKIVDKEVWIGTAKGLVNFSEDANHTNYTPPPIHISRVQIENRDTTIQDSFYLPYDQNSIQIDFEGIGFKGKGEMSYKYKLSGVEDKWINTKSRYVRYPNLQAGNYHFEVFALNEDQIISTKPASISFFIRPPWWKTWWFYILSLLSLGGIISYFINAQIQKRKRERAFLDQVNELKAMALRSQMNPHFIFNALNAIQKFLTTNNREQAMNYLSRFGKLIRAIFEQSQKEKISLEEELDFLNLYLDLEKLRFMDRVDIQIEVSPELEDISDEINIPPLLIQPIIENSFKHGFLYEDKLGVLKIHFSRQNTYLLCTIEDNGIGRKKAAELGQKHLKDRPSSGLKTSRERLDIYNTEHDIRNSSQQSDLKIIDLFDDDKSVKGTLVEIKIYCKGFEHIA